METIKGLTIYETLNTWDQLSSERRKNLLRAYCFINCRLRGFMDTEDMENTPKQLLPTQIKKHLD